MYLRIVMLIVLILNISSKSSESALLLKSYQLSNHNKSLYLVFDFGKIYKLKYTSQQKKGIFWFVGRYCSISFTTKKIGGME